MGGIPLASAHRDLTALRMALISGVALALLAGSAEPADAAAGMRFYSTGDWFVGGMNVPVRKHRATTVKRQKSEPQKDTGFGEVPKGPLQLVVSINTQKVTLFSKGVRVAQGPVSTGVRGHPTPMGVFSVIEKDRYHHSNIYSGAPMPYMQRITWSGVALHQGELPGHPASHGCIRMSHDFAKKLWPITKLGVRVIVARDELTPTEFAHAKLFVPRSKPAEPQTALSGATEDASRPTAKFAEAAIEHTDHVPSDAAPDPIKAAPVSSESVKPSPTVDPPTPLVPRYKVTDQPVTRTGQVAVFVSRKEKKVFVRQGFVPLFELPVAIEDPDQPLGTHVFTAMEVTEDGTGMRWNLMTVATGPSVSVDHRDSLRRSKEPPKPIVHGKPPSTAAQALDRIHLPQEVVDRIGELLVPGSSLVVSDEGLGRETGRGTEFIVLTR
jgi:L,D-transpeptidase catalytic domain